MKQLACILIALAFVGVYADEPDKLVSGIPTTVQENPHCISIRVNGNHFCGGSIINANTILTAAHCLAPLRSNPSMMRSAVVVSGTTYLNSGGQSYRVSAVYPHEGYNANSMVNDIGVLKLATPIQFNQNQKPISLPTSDMMANEGVTVVAWGSTGNGQQVHNNLQKMNAKCMLPDRCQQLHQNFMPVYKTEFCTLVTRGVGTCHGDSGSGVVRDNDRTICGLVSRGRPCAQGVPDVFTKVLPYVSWIKQRM